MLRTDLTERFSLDAPIIGAPMAGVSGGRLAAAVTSGGGLGMIGVGSSTPPENILRDAEDAREAGQRFGVGLMAWALAEHPGQFDAAVAAAPALVSVSFGEEAPWVRRLHEAGIPVAVQVGDAEGARAAADHGVDLIVARGSEAGGHGIDRVATLPLLQVVLEAVDVPVLAAGGIASPRGLAAVLAAGAAGGWVGTTLLGCVEATNTPAARARIRAASETDTVYTRVFDIAKGIPWPPEFGGRALANHFSARWSSHEPELSGDAHAANELAAAAEREDYDVAFLYAGQGVAMVDGERSATVVVSELAGGAEELLRRWN